MGIFDAALEGDVAGAASVMEGIEAAAVGAGVGVAAEMAEGALVAGVFVAAMELFKLTWPGVRRSVFVSVCAIRRVAHEKRSLRTVRVDRRDLPPYRTVKKGIS